MTDELDLVPEGEDENDSRVYVGFHQLGGVRLLADDIRLDPNEAFTLAGQLIAHATLVIQMSYAEQAMAARRAAEQVPNLYVPGKQ
jgi:hypothetical protein